MLYIIAGKNYPLSNLVLSQISNSDVTLIQNNTFFIYKNKFTEIIGKLCYFLKIKNTHIFSKTVYKKFSNIKKDDKILLWDIVKPDFVFFIQNAVLTKNISLWMWNKITYEKNAVIKLQKMGISIFTFDKSDAQNYGLQLKKQVCYEYPNEISTSLENQNDIYFVGFDKGRSEKIHFLLNCFKQQKLSCNFSIIPDKTTKKQFNPEINTNPINIQNNILNIIKSKCILDITKDDQTGITVRVLEAFLFHKKLITNNKNIIESELYNKENIFILDENDINNIPAFINSPFEEYDPKKLEDYYINNWIKSFI